MIRPFPISRVFDQAGYNDVLTNPAEMLDLIQYHMVTEIYTQAELGAMESVITNQGSPLALQGTR